MADKFLHIVCFDVPYPADHGGFYDLFYKIKAMYDQGVSIYLHCFEYGRGEQPILKQYCEKIFYYRRKTGLRGFSFYLPYIVASRKNEQLIQNLSSDNYPILLEGTHCTYLLYKNLFPGRNIIYRLHNIEHIYYKQLFTAEQSIFKKLYYLLESQLLQRYERKAAINATVVLAVSQTDIGYFQQYCPKASISYLPVLLPYQRVVIKEGLGTYCLYHGNLSVAENERAATWLIEKVFQKRDIPFVVAGKKPSNRLKRLAAQNKNIQLIVDPSEEAMLQLIQNAQINLVISFNATGIKLKLVNALFHGRHCLVNEAAIKGTGLDECCYIAESAAHLQQLIQQKIKETFTEGEIALRKKVLLTHFNNMKGAQKLSALLY